MSELLLNGETLEELKQRAVLLAIEHGLPDFASAIEGGCVKGGLDFLRPVPQDLQALAFSIFLDDVPGREAASQRIAALNSQGPNTDGFELPNFIVRDEPSHMHDRIMPIRKRIVRQALSSGRERVLAIVKFLSMTAIAARLTAIGVHIGAQSEERRVALATMSACLGEFAAAAVVDDRVEGVEELGEAFSLALAGYVPVRREGTAWAVSEISDEL